MSEDNRLDGLSAKVRKALAAEGITTLEQLVETFDKSLLYVPGIGHKSMAEIESCLGIPPKKKSDGPLTMARHAIRANATDEEAIAIRRAVNWRDEATEKRIIAAIIQRNDDATLLEGYGIAKKGLARLYEWCGLQPRPSAVRRASPAWLAKMAETLRRHGYTVIEPDHPQRSV